MLCLGYPLHPADKPAETDAEALYRIISPILFIQGTRDRYCELDTLRRILSRVGAPTTLQIIQAADHAFKVFKKSGRTPEDVQAEILSAMENWIAKVMES